jgi:glutathione S-transferase
MQLYYSDILSSRKACAAARYLQSPVEFRYLDLVKGDQQKPDYLVLNANGKVPTLIDGAHVVWEADAVMCYLAKKAGSDLWPNDLRQIDIIRWFSWNAQHFYRHAGTLYFENIVKRRFGIGETDTAAVAEAQSEFRRYAAVLSEHLANRKWLVGDGITVADFSVGITLPYADQAAMPLAEFPVVQRWLNQLNEIEAWREPFPRR